MGMSPREATGLSGDPHGFIVGFLFLSEPAYMTHVDIQDAGPKWGSWSFDLCMGSTWLEPMWMELEGAHSHALLLGHIFSIQSV